MEDFFCLFPFSVIGRSILLSLRHHLFFGWSSQGLHSPVVLLMLVGNGSRLLDNYVYEHLGSEKENRVFSGERIDIIIGFAFLIRRRVVKGRGKQETLANVQLHFTSIHPFFLLNAPPFSLSFSLSIFLMDDSRLFIRPPQTLSLSTALFPGPISSPE